MASEQNSTYHFNTLAIHGGQTVDPATNARAVPIYQTTSYLFNDADHAARLFALQEFGNIYSRIMNPTVDVLEKRIAALEGGVAALALASGQAAETLTMLTLARAGDEIVSTTSLYGGTYNLFHHTLPRLGITVRFVDAADYDGMRAAINAKTKAVYSETVGNPKMDVLDIEKLADIAHDNGLPLIIDNTTPSPASVPADRARGRHRHPLADEVHRRARHVDRRRDRRRRQVRLEGSGRFAEFTDPDPSYHGVVYTQAFGAAGVHHQGPRAGAARHRRVPVAVQRLPDPPRGRDAAPAHAAPFGERPGRGEVPTDPPARRVGQLPRPGGQPVLRAVRRSTCPGGAGALITFGIKGGLAAGKAFINSVKLFSLLANIGDAKSLVIHPASTTHRS